MKKIFLTVFLFLVSCSLFLIGCGGEQGNASNKANKIVIGIDDFAPMGFLDEHGKIVGFDIDLAKEAAKRMGVEPEFKVIVWENKNMEVIFGHVDMIWNGLDITPEGQQDMIFSKPYMDNRQIILVRKGNPENIHTVSDLAGKNIGTQTGSNSDTYINEKAEFRNSFAQFETYSNINEGFAALSKGNLTR